MALLGPGVMQTVVGKGTVIPTLTGPRGLAAIPGRLYVADTGANMLHWISLGVQPQTAINIGNGTAGYVEGTSAAAEFNAPQGIAVAGNFDIYIADTGNNVIRKQSSAARSSSTIIGTGASGYSEDSSGDAGDPQRSHLARARRPWYRLHCRTRATT